MLREPTPASSDIGLLDDECITEAQLEAELDEAIAAFDWGEGYPSEEASERIRTRFGW